MEAFLLRLADLISRLLTSPVFWILLLLAAIFGFLAWVYIRLKLGAL